MAWRDRVKEVEWQAGAVFEARLMQLNNLKDATVATGYLQRSFELCHDLIISVLVEGLQCRLHDIGNLPRSREEVG